MSGMTAISIIIVTKYAHRSILIDERDVCSK